MGFLDITNATKSYGNVEVLHRVDIEVEEGEFLVLVGPSGCGKSTLLNMIAGLEGITSGDIAIKGRVINGVHPSKRNIAMVFQSYALYPNMTVAQNITFGLEMHGVPKPERDAALADVSKLLQIDHLLDRKPGQLSGGQRQRVAMGRALVRKPDVFLFDEPLSNLDAKLRVDMRTEIKRLHQRMGVTIVYVTHDQIEAMTLASKIAVLKDGVLQQFGTPAEIYNDPANMFVADFMGSPSMNLIPAMIADDGAAITMQTDSGEILRLAVPPGKGLASHAGRPVIFGIRPESLTDPQSADQSGSGIVRADCLIEVVEPAGSDTFAVTRLGGKEVIARLRADTSVEPGTLMTLAFNLDKAVFFDPANEERVA